MLNDAGTERSRGPATRSSRGTRADEPAETHRALVRGKRTDLELVPDSFHLLEREEKGRLLGANKREAGETRVDVALVATRYPPKGKLSAPQLCTRSQIRDGTQQQRRAIIP